MGTTYSATPWRKRSVDSTRVLIVEPQRTVGSVVAEALTSLGYTATHCTNADEAWLLCRHGLADAVLIEVGLVTQDGQRLASLLSEEYPDLPVAVLTAWLDHPETRYIDSNGIRMVLRKPIRIDQLELAVRALVDGFRARR